MNFKFSTNHEPTMISKNIFFVLNIILINLIIFNCSKNGEKVVTSDNQDIEKDGYELVWHDEFNATELDLSKWRYRQLGPRRDGVTTADAVQFDGTGSLYLTTSKIDGEYHAGMIGTEETFQTTFGYFECRAKLQKEIGHWSAFWIQSPTVSQMGDTKITGTEIDIYEYLRRYPNRIYHNLHWDGYGDDHKTAGTTREIPGLENGYHLFALEWTESEYIFYVDDQETWRSSEAISHRDEYIILSTEVGTWAGDIALATLPDTLFVDWVRVYKPL